MRSRNELFRFLQCHERLLLTEDISSENKPTLGTFRLQFAEVNFP